MAKASELKKGMVVDRVDDTANKLIKMGFASIEGKQESVKELKDLSTKELKVDKRKTK